MCQISTFLAKRVRMMYDYNFETRFGILSTWRIFLNPKLKNIVPSIVFSKLQRFRAGSLHLADRAQISYTVFGYHMVTFETLTPCNVKQVCFSLHPIEHHKHFATFILIKLRVIYFHPLFVFFGFSFNSALKSTE